MSDVLRIVVADDAVLLRAGITRILEAAGWAVTGEVDNADDLLAAVRRDRPDVAVVDIRMPPGHSDEGIRATQAIREEFGEEVAVLVACCGASSHTSHTMRRRRCRRSTATRHSNLPLARRIPARYDAGDGIGELAPRCRHLPM